MKKNQKHLVWQPLIIALSVVVGILIGLYYFQPQGLMQSGGTSKVNELLQIINRQYVDTVNIDEMVEKIMPMAISELDPHSTYIPADELAIVNEDLEGSFSGIGIQFNITNDTVTVVAVIPGGPSEKVGLQAGDRIISINDSAFVGKAVSEDAVMKNLRGAKGTIVKVGVKRRMAKKTLDFEIERGDIPSHSVDTWFKLNDKVGYLKISKFGRTTYKEMMSALAELQNQGASQFIIDLRYNAGGYLEAAINMVNEFLPKGQLIVYTQGRAYPRSDAFSDGRGVFKDAPLIVLLNEWSASASEIFAGAVQDNDRGTIIGRRSYGKGLVQQQMDLRDGSAVRLTVARYYTPSGRSIQKDYKLGGGADYELDILNRYNHGEIFVSDSVKQDTAKIFKTLKGRTVYGGGGITPDYFIPQDTSGINSYYHSLANSGVFIDFAFDYVDKNRGALKNIKNDRQLVSYLDSQPILDEVVQMAAKNGVRPRPVYIAESRKLILRQVYALIARNALGDKAFYRLSLDGDQTINRALDVLQKGESKPSK